MEGLLQKIWGQKRAKCGAILDNFRLRSQISPKRIEISKIGKLKCQQRFFPRLATKIWSIDNKVAGVSLDPRKFSEDHISAPSGCYRLNFLHALENDQGRGPQQFVKKNI